MVLPRLSLPRAIIIPKARQPNARAGTISQSLGLSAVNKRTNQASANHPAAHQQTLISASIILPLPRDCVALRSHNRARVFNRGGHGSRRTARIPAGVSWVPARPSHWDAPHCPFLFPNVGYMGSSGCFASNGLRLSHWDAGRCPIHLPTCGMCGIGGSKIAVLAIAAEGIRCARCFKLAECFNLIGKLPRVSGKYLERQLPNIGRLFL